MTLSLSEIVRRFNELFAKKRTALLSGAGISIASGIPDAMGIAKVLLEILGVDALDLSEFLGKPDNVKKPELPVAFEAIIGAIDD